MPMNKDAPATGLVHWNIPAGDASLCHRSAGRIHSGRESELAQQVDSPAARVRVLFVIGTMGGGGAERQVVEILKRLDRTRFEPHLYLAMKQGELLGDVPADVPIVAYWDGSAETWPRRILRWCKLTRLARYAHLAKVLRRSRIDVIYDRTYLATLDAAGACWLRPTPRISCCVVDPEPELKLHARWSVACSWWFARRAYLAASIVLANSTGLRSRLIDYFQLPTDRVQVIYNLLTAAASSPVRQIEAHETPAGPDPTPFLIVTAGRLHAQKGQRYLLHAVRQLVQEQHRSLKLLIFGKGEAEAELREEIQTSKLSDNVTLMGFENDLRPWFRKADLFVLPSLYEGMPNALIEAVASEVPVVSTDCPSGPREILDGGRLGGLVPAADAAALAMAIADAMDHPDQLRSRVAAARQHIEELFDPNTGMRKLQSLIEQVARSVDQIDAAAN